MVIAVQDSKKISNEILNGVGVGLSLLDRNLRICWLNKTQEHWFGDHKLICGQHCYKVYQHRKEVCPHCPSLKAIQTGKPHRAIQIGYKSNGEKHYYQLDVTPIKNQMGKVIYALESVYDVTKARKDNFSRKRIIAKLRGMCKSLIEANHKLKEYVSQLKKFNKKTQNFDLILKSKLKSKVKELHLVKEELCDIFKINESICENLDLKKLLTLIVKYSCKMVSADACSLRLLDRDKNILVTEAGYGLSESFLTGTPLKVGEGIAGLVAKLKKPLAIENLQTDPRLKHKAVAIKEGLKSVLSVPAMINGKLLGVITASSKTPRKFTEDEIKILTAFATQAAIALEEKHIYQDTHMTYFNTIYTLVLAMEAKDPYTKGHSERVTQYAIEIARKLGFSEERIEILRFSGWLHDVGKIAISDLILNKPGKLTCAERAIIELHPVKAVEMLRPLKFLEDGIPIVKHHHERYDGNGYPDRLKKQEIPVFARILSCADAFDAMTSSRPYRSDKMNFEEAIEELKSESGRQFDPQITHTFIKIIKEGPLV
jgi:putative nucleotidyltransferase with HDIG domain